MKRSFFILGLTLVFAGCVTGESESDIVDSLACPVEPSSESCQLYGCVESAMSCGAKGYPLAYGETFCKSLLGLCNDSLFTQAERKWAAAANQCLQAATYEAQVLGGDCKQLAARSFEAHAHCYTEGTTEAGAPSICSLGPDSWHKLKTCVDSGDRFGKLGVIQFAKVLAGCSKRLASGEYLQGSDAPDASIQKDWSVEADNLSKQWVSEVKD